MKVVAKPMFIGQKELAVDDKNRLVLPAVYRNDFQGGTCYASLGLDFCIELYPQEVYGSKASRITSLDDFDPKARKIKRTFLGNTFELTIDSHCRILLPKSLVEKTNLGKKTIIVGMYDHLELWNADAYAERSSEEEASYAEDASQLISRHE